MALYRFFYDPKAVEEFTALVNTVFDDATTDCRPDREATPHSGNKAFRPRYVRVRLGRLVSNNPLQDGC